MFERIFAQLLDAGVPYEEAEKIAREMVEGK